MRLGAVRAGATESQEASRSVYGRAVGLSVQIVDDVLDLTATEEVLGKPVASDLREGKATLAVIHSIDHGTAKDRQVIQRVLDDRSEKLGVLDSFLMDDRLARKTIPTTMPIPAGPTRK